MSECERFLDDRIRSICGLGSDVELTEELLRDGLDEVDLGATTMNSGGRLGGLNVCEKELQTHKDAVAQREFVRSAEF